MSTLYLYNKGRQIHIQIENIHIQFLGSKILNRFLTINDYGDGCISVETEFNKEDTLFSEEDYIDLRDVFGDYNYDVEKIIKSIKEIKIGEPEMRTISKNELIEKSIMVSDNMALISKINNVNQVQIYVINMKNTNARALINLADLSVLSTNMSEKMLKRAIDAIKRNKEQILEEIKERNAYA